MTSVQDENDRAIFSMLHQAAAVAQDAPGLSHESHDAPRQGHDAPSEGHDVHNQDDSVPPVQPSSGQDSAPRRPPSVWPIVYDPQLHAAHLEKNAPVEDSPSVKAAKKTEAAKHRLFALLDHSEKLGLSKNDCYRLEGISPRTGRHWQQAYREKRKPAGPRSGRPKTLSKELIEEVVVHIRQNHPHYRTIPWTQLRDHFNLKCCPTTIQRALREAGYNKCAACQKAPTIDVSPDRCLCSPETIETRQ